MPTTPVPFFVSCMGTVTIPNLIGAPVEFDSYIIKLDQTGRRDSSWGDAGVYKIPDYSVIACDRNENCRPSFSAPSRHGGY